MPIKLDWKRERRWLASFGLALAAAGLIRYTTQGELTRVSEILLIGGGVLFLAGLVLSYRDFVTFFSARSSQLGANGAPTATLPAGQPIKSATSTFCGLLVAFVEVIVIAPV